MTIHEVACIHTLLAFHLNLIQRDDAIACGLFGYVAFGLTTLHHSIWEGMRVELVGINQLMELTSAVLVSVLLVAVMNV